MPDDLAHLDATAQAALVRTGEASPLELVDAAIARVEALNPALNAVIHERFDAARSEAAEAAGPLPDGPFRGVPFLLKDLDGTAAGEPFWAGTRFLRERGFRAATTSALTDRFRAAGLVCLGRSNTPELGLLPTTEPLSTGPAHNPWDVGRSPGGSSGGSAAAVAAGLVPLAHAGDGGGSIRIPASACGLVGLKPSRGRISVGPEVGEAWGGMVARLAVTRSVRDTAALLEAVHGPLPGDPYWAPPPARPYVEEVGADPGRLRIGVLADAPPSIATTHPACARAAREAGQLLASLGHAVEEAAPPLLHDEARLGAFVGHFTTAFAAWVAAELAHIGALVGNDVTEDGVEPGTWALGAIGQSVTAVQYQQAIAGLHTVTRDVVGWWHGGFDLLVTPTMPEPPLLLGQFAATPEDPLAGLVRSTPVVVFTALVNATGQPAISLPLATHDGLPIGVQLVAAPAREDVLIRVAAQLEQTDAWQACSPRVHA